MPKKKAAPRRRVPRVEATPRDYVMARLGAARAGLAAATEAVDEALAYYAEPDDDADGEERAELMDAADESLGAATRALQEAQRAMAAVDPEEGEDDLEEDEDEEEDDDEDDDE